MVEIDYKMKLELGIHARFNGTVMGSVAFHFMDSMSLHKLFLESDKFRF